MNEINEIKFIHDDDYINEKNEILLISKLLNDEI